MAARGPFRARPGGLRHHGQDPCSLGGLCSWTALIVPLVSHETWEVGRRSGIFKGEDGG